MMNQEVGFIEKSLNSWPILFFSEYLKKTIMREGKD